MIKILKVQGSQEQAVPLIVGVDTVYLHTNIKQAVDENGKPIEGLFTYDEVQYTKDEYIALMAKQNENLAVQVTDTQIAVTELFEML